jgi:hypothetical protein
MVVAVDLPGIGRSAPPAGGYDAANLANLYRLAGAKCCRTAPVLDGIHLFALIKSLRRSTEVSTAAVERRRAQRICSDMQRFESRRPSHPVGSPSTAM